MIQLMNYYYHCVKCDRNYTRKAQICCHNIYYEYIEILYDYDLFKRYPREKRREQMRKLTPLKTKPISLGEGNTPLIQIKDFAPVCGKHTVYVKNEASNPTGSFKDRESALVISKAAELKYHKVYIISSGNAALSAAVYANKVKINCECFIPVKTSKSKKKILQLFCQSLHLSRCGYEDIYRKVVDNAKHNGWNITSGQNFYREEGSKTIAYEIWDSVGVPNIVIIPIGNGTLFSAVHKGFVELRKVGLTNRIPKFIGVQIKGASPIKTALEQRVDYAVLDTVPDSIAEGIIARESYCSPKVIRAINESRGDIIEVTDAETILALKDIMRTESLIPETTSATVYAALRKLVINSKKKLTIICLQTGSGIKELEGIVRLLNI